MLERKRTLIPTATKEVDGVKRLFCAWVVPQECFVYLGSSRPSVDINLASSPVLDLFGHLAMLSPNVPNFWD
jgi:hypothetical protein